MSFEERLGTQWAVWVGGIALALGGIFLVRYSIEQGLLGPGVRVALGALLAAALIIAGEWARRTRAARRHLRAAQGAHPEHPHRRRHHDRLRRRLCGVPAVRFHRARHRLHLARDRRAGNARSGAAARAGACRPRARRRLCDADPGLHRPRRLLGALPLSRSGDRGCLRARALPAVALARHHGGCTQCALDPAGHRRAQCDGDRGACLPCGRELRAGCGADRCRAAVRTGRAARPHRRRVVGCARRLSAGDRLAGARQPARPGRADHVHRPGRGHGGDRMARARRRPRRCRRPRCWPRW